MTLLAFLSRLFPTYHSGPPARTVLSTSGRTRKRRHKAAPTPVRRLGA